MCWSEQASLAGATVGAVATGLSIHRRDPTAVWLTLGYFTGMEGLQVAGYAVLDQCGTAANRSVTLLSYLHIVFQPIFINAFALTLVSEDVRRRASFWAITLSALASGVMLLQMAPGNPFGECLPGTPLCGADLCTRSGEWHIAWDIPYNGFLVPLESWTGTRFGFPSYILAVFVLPLFYGAWRFVLFHALAGPVAASFLTSDPNEMPAIWCLFSIGIVLIALSPVVRRTVSVPA